MTGRGFDSASESHQCLVSSFRRRPESRGVRRGECSAGACPPLGRRRGVAESAVPIRRTKPQLQLFIPWCVGASRRSKEKCRAGACPQPGEGWRAQATPEPFHQPIHPIFIPWCAGTSRGSKENCRVGARPQPGEGWGAQATPEPFHRPMHPIFIPSCAGHQPRVEREM